MIRSLCIAVVALLLGGCATFNELNNEVSTFGPWPPGRTPGAYVFERLPSQQARPERQQLLENAARGALEAVGFRPVADPNDAEHLVQLGARVATDDPWIHNDPLFWPGRWGWGGGHRYRYGPWGPGPFWGLHGGFGTYGPTRFEREAVLLIRDRKTGQLLYEARASNTGPSASIDYLLPAMFAAALKDFPRTGPNPRDVVVPLSTR